MADDGRTPKTPHHKEPKESKMADELAIPDSSAEKVHKAISKEEKIPEDIKAAIEADPHREVAPTEALQTLLDTLTSQRAQLRARKAMEETQRSKRKAREEARTAAAAAAAKRAYGAPWRRPCVMPEELNKPGMLPAKFLPPYQQQAVDRPAKTIEKHLGAPFLDTSPYPMIFGEPPTFELSARQRKAKALADAGKIAMTAGKSVRTSRPEVVGSKVGVAAATTTEIGLPWNPAGGPPQLIHKTNHFLHERLSGAMTVR